MKSIKLTTENENHITKNSRPKNFPANQVTRNSEINSYHSTLSKFETRAINESREAIILRSNVLRYLWLSSKTLFRHFR